MIRCTSSHLHLLLLLILFLILLLHLPSRDPSFWRVCDQCHGESVESVRDSQSTFLLFYLDTSSHALEFETGFDHAMAFVHPPKVTSTGTKLESTALYEPKAPFPTVRPPKHKFVSAVRCDALQIKVTR